MIKLVRFIFMPVIWIATRLKLIAIRFHGRDAAKERAIKKATRKHLKDNRRYRVFFIALRYRVWNRDDIKNYKKRGIFKRHINSTNIDQFKFFDTNDLSSCS